MSGRGGNAYSKGNNNGVSAIPSGSRKMVQSLKEIVNCPEAEIYAMLKDCNMDPDDAVNRLISQDTFHEVKSKREKKKENKDTSSDSKSRFASNSNRGGRDGTDCHSASSHLSSRESGAVHGKPACRKENGAHAYTGYSSSAWGMTGNDIHGQPPSHSQSATNEKKTSAARDNDISLPMRSASACQPTWSAVPGQLSMADIVKMGRPQHKAPLMAKTTQHSFNHPNAWAKSSYLDLCSSQDHASKSEVKSEAVLDMSHNATPYDDWHLVEKLPAPGASSVLEASTDSDLCADPPSSQYMDRTYQHLDSPVDESEEIKDYAIESLTAILVRPDSVSSRNTRDGNSAGASPFQDELYDNVNSYKYERNEDGFSAVSVNLEQLNLQKDECGVPSGDDNPSVIIPSHLQVHTSECAHLSFGSFGSHGTSAFSGVYGYRHLEETSTTADDPSVTRPDTKNSKYYGDEHLKTSLDESLAPRTGVSTGSYDTRPTPKEGLKHESLEAALVNQYNVPTAAPGYTYEEAQHLNATFTHPWTSSQIQNLPSFSQGMQGYTNLLPSSLLASSAQSIRESDLPYSPFPMSQSMSTKYESETSVSGSAIPMPESLRAGSISASQPTPQNLSGAGISAGAALPQHLLPQHLTVHPYSQPPLGHFANMISYPFLPQNYTYMPSAFQQAFADNSTYHQSLAAILPEYKNSVSVSSLPQLAPNASAYGFGGSTNIPANYSLNPPTAPAGTGMSYDELISLLYKENNHLMSLQQNHNSAMWVQGPGTRMMSSVPASNYYSFQGQNQQPTGFRQGEQPAQHFSALGYPNFYHSQTGMSPEHQQQNPREGSQSSSQVQPSQQLTQQMWQNNY